MDKITNWFHGIRGENITNGLRSFNNWRDDFLIELSTLLLMIGFIMGTVDILTRGGLVTMPWFTLSWAIVQAVAIDGLFFAVWGKIARAKWEEGKRARLVAMVLVGIVLAVVATLVNDILSYQQLANIADSLIAMRSLHIDSSLFVNVRAILVVAVALLVQLFCRSHSPNVATSVAPTMATATLITEECTETSVATSRSRSRKRATIVEGYSPQSKAIPQHSTLERSPDMGSHSLDTVAHSPVSVALTTVAHSPTIGTVAPIEATHSLDTVAPTTVAHSPVNDNIEAMAMEIVATSGYGHREKIKATWLRFLHEGRVINLRDIATDANVGYSTVKKWASSVREEIEHEQG